ncbi:MAG: TonB-dependent receptor [Alphaproteobacteria bacterium]|nr:TonB-dependent receptor [Alphaproteobacteria bacterium]MBV9692988.1 TonB-dependent receptor [Alphaproteobacteria bacterium]
MFAAVLLGAAHADEGALQPETVVVTATRSPQPVEVTGTSISVITAQDIETQQIEVLSDALAETPGLEVSRNGGTGQTTSVSIRGAETGQTLVLIDGVRLNDPSAVDDQAILGDVLVNNIARVEVLRGPQSTLYGSDAIGGVVDIFTRRGGETPFALTASAEGGSFGTWHANAAANGSAGALDYGAAVNAYGTDGISAADARNGNSETDPYRNFGATMNARWQASNSVSLDLRAYYTDSHADFDGFPPPDFSFRDDAEFGTASLVAGYAGVNVNLAGGRFQNRLAVIASQSNRKDFGEFDFLTGAFTPAENFFARGDAARLEYQGIFDWNARNQFVFGAETQRVSISTQSLEFDPGPTHGSKRIDGTYAQWQSAPLDGLTLTGGVRLDHDTEFGTHTSLKLAAAWQADDATTLRANFGTGFKAPTLYELFSQYRNPFHPLLPETAQAFEAGLDRTMLGGRLRASLTGFARHTGNLIDFVETNTPPFGYYENIGRTRSIGVEAEISARLGDALSVSADYTAMTSKNLATGLDLARRADSLASGTLTWRPHAKLTLGGSVVFTGARFDDAADLVPLKADTTVNLFGSYALTPKLEVFARVENLFDDLNEPVFGYGRMGRAVYGGLRAGM